MIDRSAGILLPIFSLPSPYGIGTLGKAAYNFADFLHTAHQHYWQILPLGPTSYGDSPYQSFSSFAGNPYLIDLDLLIQDKLLTKEEVTALPWGNSPRLIDYGVLYENRLALLQRAKNCASMQDWASIRQFAQENHSWLDEYVLFMALKRHFDMKPWYQWPVAALRLHQSDAIAHYRQLLQEDIELFTFIQYQFFKQWTTLKQYLHHLGIRIIGDVPIYVALDSADVWSEADLFELDRNNLPTAVAGVPPDYFSKDGQLWGNPLYRYQAMQNDGFSWWIRRIGGASKLYDVIRMDHFRGFAEYWSVPYGEQTARRGHWVKGPGNALVSTLTNWFHDVDFIAEDLGTATQGLTALLRQSGLPGMKVLSFAFQADELSTHLPHAYTQNCICYSGTHDNAPLALWSDELSDADRAFALQYLGIQAPEQLCDAVLRCGQRSVAKLFIAQMQDYLHLGAGHRINTPGSATGNWKWRLLPGELTPRLAAQIAAMTTLYARD